MPSPSPPARPMPSSWLTQRRAEPFPLASSWERPFQARSIRLAATSSNLGLRASSHHCPVNASIEVPSNPRSANRRRPIPRSCSRRSFPVILLRPDAWGWELTGTSSRLRGRRATYPVGAPRHGAEFPLRGGGPLGGEPLLVRPAHVVGPAQLLERPDDPGAGVELALQCPV